MCVHVREPVLVYVSVSVRPCVSWPNQWCVKMSRHDKSVSPVCVCVCDVLHDESNERTVIGTRICSYVIP